jgi:ribosome-binding protein aMBF1 (putative translation factor)
MKKKTEGEGLAVCLGCAIKSARWQNEMKSKDLAAHLGVANSHISEIEHGKKTPSIELLYRMEKLLGPIWMNL